MCLFVDFVFILWMCTGYTPVVIHHIALITFPRKTVMVDYVTPAGKGKVNF